MDNENNSEQDEIKLVPQKSESEIMRGTLDPGALPDYIDFLVNKRKCGRLEVTFHEYSGTIWVKDRTILAAAADGFVDELAIHNMLIYGKAQFVFVETNLLPKRRIMKDAINIMLEGAKVIDESSGHHAKKGNEELPEELKIALPEKPTLQREDEDKQEELDKVHTEFAQMIEDSDKKSAKSKKTSYLGIAGISIYVIALITIFIKISGTDTPGPQDTVLRTENALKEKEIKIRKDAIKYQQDGDKFLAQGRYIEALRSYKIADKSITNQSPEIKDKLFDVYTIISTKITEAENQIKVQNLTKIALDLRKNHHLKLALKKLYEIEKLTNNDPKIAGYINNTKRMIEDERKIQEFKQAVKIIKDKAEKFAKEKKLKEAIKEYKKLNLKLNDDPKISKIIKNLQNKLALNEEKIRQITNQISIAGNQINTIRKNIATRLEYSKTREEEFEKTLATVLTSREQKIQSDKLKRERHIVKVLSQTKKICNLQLFNKETLKKIESMKDKGIKLAKSGKFNEAFIVLGELETTTNRLLKLLEIAESMIQAKYDYLQELEECNEKILTTYNGKIWAKIQKTNRTAQLQLETQNYQSAKENWQKISKELPVIYRQALANKLDQEFNQQIMIANNAFKKKLWEEVATAANKALTLKPDAQVAKNFLTKIHPIINIKTLLADKEIIGADIWIDNIKTAETTPIQIHAKINKSYTIRVRYTDKKQKHYGCKEFKYEVTKYGPQEIEIGIRLILFPWNLNPVKEAKYADCAKLFAGSKNAQNMQKQLIQSSGLPLEVTLPKSKIHLRLVPAGSFNMGSDNLAENPVHKVTISKPMYVGKFEISQKEWQAIMRYNPSRFSKIGFDAPVECVSWGDCQEFCRLLCKKEGYKEGRIRLLTEAEWEYCCRAGTTGDSPTDKDRISWNILNSGNNTRKVGLKVGNAWGLHDFLGNVWEWCEDWYDINYYSQTIDSLDPHGPLEGINKVFRGGSWNNSTKFCRSACRFKSVPSNTNNMLGLRIVLISDK